MEEQSDMDPMVERYVPIAQVIYEIINEMSLQHDLTLRPVMRDDDEMAFIEYLDVDGSLVIRAKYDTASEIPEVELSFYGDDIATIIRQFMVIWNEEIAETLSQYIPQSNALVVRRLKEGEWTPSLVYINTDDN